MAEANHAVIMENLKDKILRLANSDPNNPLLSPSQVSFVQQRLQLAFPVLHTPTHPPYSAMIQNAIRVLNEEGGSNESSISNFIKANYEDLPWAHSTYLSHHLSKLCENGEITRNSTSKCYTMLARAETQEVDPMEKQRNWTSDKARKEEDTEEIRRSLKRRRR